MSSSQQLHSNETVLIGKTSVIFYSHTGHRLSCILSLWGLRLWQLIRMAVKKHKKQVKNSCNFWGVFLLFCKRKRAGSWAFPQILLHEMDVLEKRKSTAGELTWRGCRAALWVGVCKSAGLSSATSFSASPHLHQQDIQAQPHQSILLALKHESVCTSSR